MDIEALNAEFNRLQKELARLKATDPDYKPVSENLERIGRIVADYEKRDLERINSNVSNDVKEDNVRLEHEKIKTDRMREHFSLIKTVLGIGASVGMGLLAYKQETVDFHMPFRELWNTAKNLIPRK